MVAGARRAFEGRLVALSAAHNLLTDQNWEGATIRQVIEGGMAAYRSGDRVRISGPNLPLAPKTAVSLAMAVHELATNATKYGSLSGGEGKVEIDWSAKGGKLDLIWRESGGPPVARPARRGFGSRMIERGLAAELSGTVALDFAPAGLVCTVSAPLPAREAA
jgi:two-component sensor histidine kinase